MLISIHSTIKLAGPNPKSHKGFKSLNQRYPTAFADLLLPQNLMADVQSLQPLSASLIHHATLNAEQRRKPREQVAKELSISVCSRTLKVAFEKEQYHRRKATEKPCLPPEHIAVRHQWAWKRLNWQWWDDIIWTDEAYFYSSGGEIFVTRKAEEKYLPECCKPKFKDFSSVMIWGAISSKGKGPLII